MDELSVSNFVSNFAEKNDENDCVNYFAIKIVWLWLKVDQSSSYFFCVFIWKFCPPCPDLDRKLMHVLPSQWGNVIYKT